MEFENKIKSKLLMRGFTQKQILNNRGLIAAVIDETILLKTKNLTMPVSSLQLKEKEEMTFDEYKTKHLEHNRIYKNNYEHKIFGWISVDSFVNMYLKDLNL